MPLNGTRSYLLGYILALAVLLAPTATAVPFQLQDVNIPMSDGGHLAADVYLPGDGTTYPTILSITSSSKEKCSIQFYPRAAFYESGDYALVCVERRGSFGSAGNPPRPGINPDGWDGYDVVEWIAQQPWSNGKVGMWGASNQGKIQYATAMTNPPHLVCIMPAETTARTREYDSPGISYEQAYPGGVLRLELIENAIESQQLNAGQPGTGLAQLALDHPLDDGFFDQRPDGAPTLRDVKVPVMAIGAWFDNDNNRATAKLFNEILNNTDPELRIYHRLLIGPWTHNGVYTDGVQGQLEFNGAAVVYRQREKQFFDYWLRGIDNGEATAPPVTWYQMGENEWKTAETWPPAGVQPVTFYLQQEGQLARTPPSADVPPDRFVSNPNNPVPTVGGQNKQKTFGKGPHDQREEVESHPDVLLFTTEPLGNEISVAGDIRVQLFIASDSEDTDVAFRLTDVYPDGRSMLLRDGILRMSLRRTRMEYEFLTPGQIFEGTIETIPLAHTFLEGHRIRLILSSSNFPRYDVNTNTRDKSGEPQIATNMLYHDAEHPSALILSVRDAALSSSPPLINPGGTVNGASFRAETEPNSAVAPGGMVAIFGTELADTTLVASDVPLPTMLGDTSVTFNFDASIAAPLFFVSPTQINAQVPFDVPTGTVTVQAKRGSEVSVAQEVEVVAVSPGIFTVNQQGTGAGAILHAADFQLVSDSAPARPGEFLSIFCTGLGALQSPLPSGDIPPSPPPETVTLPQVNIAEIPALVTFSGLAPGFVGLYQVNVQVPAGVPSGTQHLQLIIQGVPSNTVTIAVQ